jgi:hypothetical protein
MTRVRPTRTSTRTPTFKGTMRKAFALVLAVCTTVLLIGGLAPAANAATASTFYVNCARAQNGDGSIGAPWNSLAAVNAHGQFLAGERILLHRATTCRGRVHPAGNGQKGSPIVLGAYASGALPIIDGKGTPDRTGAIQLTDQSYWTVQDLHVRNTVGGRSSSVYRAGVLLVNSGAHRLNGLTVQRLTVDSVASNMSEKKASPREWGGIAAVTNGRKKVGFTGLQILHNTVSKVGRTGIVVSNHAYPLGQDLQLRVAYNTVKSPRGDGIVVLGSAGARVDHNTVVNANSLFPCAECHGISPMTANAAIWTAWSKHVQIDHNEAYGTKAKGGDGEGLDVDSSAVDTVVEYNYAHDNEGGGVLLCGSNRAVVRFNIFENNAKSAVAFIGSIPAKSTSIYNNTIYNSTKSRSRVVRYFNGAHGSGISFKNNLIYSYSMDSYLWPTKPKTAANTLIGSHGAGRPSDSRTSYVNPGLKKAGSGRNGFKTLGGYKPKHPSSFKKGVAIPKSVKVDFFGKKINPSKPPRGAAG